MPFRHTLVAAVAFVAFLAATPGNAADAVKPFALLNVIKPSLDDSQTDILTIRVSTKGSPPDQGQLSNVNNWRLAIVTDAEGSRPVAVDQVTWHAATKMATLTFKRSATYGADLEKSGWFVAFVGSQVSVASVDAPSGAFKAAKDKDDASFYAFGSLLVGPGTKPLYVIDLKIDYGNEIKTSGWLWSVGLTANTNTDAEAPVDESRVDPDAISTSLAFTKRQTFTSGPVGALKYTITPLDGEFARKNGTAAAVTAGQVQVNFATVANSFTFYPSAGYEIGHSIVKPATVKDQPVDLADWNAIARGLVGASARWTLFKASPTEDDWYIVTVWGSYTARIPFAGEPMGKTGTVGSARAVVTTVNKDVRQYAQAELDWTPLKFTSIALKYQYGALPPLFQLVDHQFTLGVTFKAKKS
jgi:hypothetical protein